MKRTLTPTMILLAAAVIAAFAGGISLAEGPADSDRCYAALTCFGDIAIVGQPRNIVELTHFFFNTPIGDPLPSVMDLHKTDESRFLAFESQCNADRYALTPLDPDTHVAWDQDKRFMYATLSLTCIDAGQCSLPAQPCHADDQCCPSETPGMVSQCELVSGTCQEVAAP